MPKTWLITGCSRGFGLSLARAVVANGDRLVATARRLEPLAEFAEFGDAVQIAQLDVTNVLQSKQVVDQAIATFGALDVVVNNAGYGFLGAVEELTDDDIRGQIDANFWGTVNVTRAALPQFRNQGYGHFIQFTSIGGRRGSAGLAGYHAAKFAVEGFSETLALEVEPFGIKVTIVEPGGFRTDWAGESMAMAPELPGYEATVGFMRRYLRENTGKEAGDPDKAAQILLKLAELPEPPLRLPLGRGAVMLLRQSYQKSLAELERWAELGEAVDFADAVVDENARAFLTGNS